MDRNSWSSFETECRACTRCGLKDHRTQVVIGRGTNLSAPLMFIGEGPGEQEDLLGQAFVGRAGKLLDLLLEALQFKENDYYIANIVKCRPPNNRIPTDDEAEACLFWLRKQVMAIKPKIVVCLGSTAAKYIIDREIRITQQRGKWVDRPGHFLIMPTYHPSAVLRDISKRKDFFSDLRMVRDRLVELGLITLSD